MMKNIRVRKLHRKEATTCRDYVLIQLEELLEQYDNAIKLNERLFQENQALKERVSNLEEQLDSEEYLEKFHRVVK